MFHNSLYIIKDCRNVNKMAQENIHKLMKFKTYFFHSCCYLFLHKTTQRQEAKKLVVATKIQLELEKKST